MTSPPSPNAVITDHLVMQGVDFEPGLFADGILVALAEHGYAVVDRDELDNRGASIIALAAVLEALAGSLGQKELAEVARQHIATLAHARKILMVQVENTRPL